MQRQMMQNRYRMMQSGFGGQAGMMQQQRLRDGSCSGQFGYGGQTSGAMQRKMLRNHYRMMQNGLGGQAGMMQQQRLRNGLGAGQVGNGAAIGPMQMQMLQNRLRN